MPEQPLLTTAQLAEKLSVCQETVLAWARTGRIPCIRMGHKTQRYRLDEVLAALEGGNTEATEPTTTPAN